MKIALYQMRIEWENKQVNYLHTEKKLMKAAQRDVELILLPEMSFTGFSMNTEVTKENNFETVNRLSQYAQEYKIAIGFGWVKDCGEKSENHYTIVDKKGELLSDYVKIHPFSYMGENQYFQGGSNIVTFQLNNISFSSFICYDLRFPEVFQAASKVANIIFVPANWPERRRQHWKCLLQARAIENQVYIIAVNCVGEIGGIKYSGDSCVIDPEGRVLVESSGREEVLEYELLDNVEGFRNVFQMKNDRREDLYRSFL